ncbi:E3 ubiquitin-protein ligase SINA-like 7 [Panicum miliaceum]|uniref:E3 ubiquitin-protein ligase SINA-like 7 n=1 Tax=Panicum miliaceum TaxID=4540 RepID=A0A3L6S0X9_PANMI|nr:E3 ubiquitin-protein ligase SINA-like 7 [Panicum miliaceum]
MCPHAPCSYPGSKDNGFLGSTEAILDHFTGVNDWPFTTKIRAEADNLEMCNVDLYDGFSFLLADHAPDDQAECYPSESFYRERTATPQEAEEESERERREGCGRRARLAAAAEVKERKRARMITSASGPSSSVPPAGGVVAVEDTDTLDCGICYLPLKPPIFQCDVGHVVCSPCRDKLKDNRKCHVCRGATGGFRRCHFAERVVESTRVACQTRPTAARPGRPTTTRLTGSCACTRPAGAPATPAASLARRRPS